LRIAPRSLLAYTSTVQYGVESCSSFSNVMFGDESLFVTTLEGPGTVWMQGMSPQFYIRKETRISSSSRRSSSSPSTSSSTSRRDARQTGLGVRPATPFQSTFKPLVMMCVCSVKIAHQCCNVCVPNLLPNKNFTDILITN
jgi:hypothetical protein